MKKQLMRLLSCVMAVALAPLMLSTLADAAPTTDPSLDLVVGAATEPGAAPRYIVVDIDSVTHVGEDTFYPTGPVDDDTLVFVPDEDGTYLGFTKEQLLTVLESPANQKLSASTLAANVTATAALAAQVTSAFDVTPLAYTYTWIGPPLAWSKAFSGIAMQINSSYKYYGFSVQEATAQHGCGQGRGWWRGYNGSTMGNWSSWYGVGCTSSGTATGANVPWVPNLMATMQFRGMSTVVVQIASGKWWV